MASLTDLHRQSYVEFFGRCFEGYSLRTSDEVKLLKQFLHESNRMWFMKFESGHIGDDMIVTKEFDSLTWHDFIWKVLPNYEADVCFRIYYDRIVLHLEYLIQREWGEVREELNYSIRPRTSKTSYVPIVFINDPDLERKREKKINFGPPLPPFELTKEDHL